MTILRFILAPCALALAATCAAAQSNPAPQNGTQRASGAAQDGRSAAAGASAPREAQDPEAARRLFRELDRNGDGCLRDDELWSERARQANWAAVDRNRDGCITPDEFTVVRPR